MNEGIPVSDSIRMRPVWKRRQRRLYMWGPLGYPSDAEKHDAILVLQDPENQTYAPGLYLEAERIFQESSRSS